MPVTSSGPKVQYRVIAERPWLLKLRLLAGIVLMLIACGLAFGLGYVNGFRAEQETVNERDWFRASFAQASLELAELRQRVADLSVEAEIEDELGSKYRASVKALESRIAELEEEVKFYRALMAPEADDHGLHIESLDLEPMPDPGKVRYKLLLTQVEQKHGVVQGKVTLNFIGTRDGETLVLPLDEIAELGEYPLVYRFRYFQSFPGVLQLPEGFAPQSVEVIAEARGGRGRLERSFAWAVEEG